MRIGITGSWRQDNSNIWTVRDSLPAFASACQHLGAALVNAGARIVVGSERPHTADKYVTEAYLKGSWQPRSICVIRPNNSSRPFLNHYNSHPEAFVFMSTNEASWRFTRQMFISEVDTMITIGGSDGTYQVGLEITLGKKRLIPIGSFGGASERLLDNLIRGKRIRDPARFMQLNNPWHPRLADLAVALAGVNEPSKVLLIHGHAQDRHELQSWLEAQRLAKPVVMVQEFTAGQTIPEKFEALAAEADAAIALATPDDLAAAATEIDRTRLRARQNVWVEVGWFWGRLGRDRVMLLVRGDVEVPSDLDGIIYHSYAESPLEQEETIKQFLLHISETNQQ